MKATRRREERQRTAVPCVSCRFFSFSALRSRGPFCVAVRFVVIVVVFLPQRLLFKAHRFVDLGFMASASASAVRIPSWADALGEETLTAVGVQPAEAHDAPSDMPEGGSTEAKPPAALPPYAAEDNPERGIQCYVKGCRAPVMHNWKTLFEHVRWFHNVQQSRMKHTSLYQASREEINKEDRRRYKLKHGIPLSDEDTVTVATKRMKEEPEPSVKGPSADEVAGTSSDNPSHGLGTARRILRRRLRRDRC